ncbi:class I SAM-dependent methyltransferase [Costertonia aggregata]|uniref:Class I SAM-dependent methyltransferase n=1 Tax=Costertonia aggregata TaxID=343403 RepID=A0A7H9AMR7_9FLAO|nr:class I SAM-dependent methyltransferase [Costertonia aggregata]QLG44746.1 class I SAM-dependent methyltransferase [Costertonia aggregata]
MDTSFDKQYTQFWEERYGASEYAYGKEPNVFFKECLDKLSPGNILLPADGEGRNGVYAATQGWEVISTDLSRSGKEKTMQLAKDFNVSLDYEVGDILEMDFPEKSFDAIALIYAHFTGNKVSEIHQKLVKLLKPGGIIIFEAYSEKNLEYKKVDHKVGGPMDIDMLFSKDKIKRDFKGFQIIQLEELDVQLSEGSFHNGIGNVVRFVGKKHLD